ncbi:histidine kinase [Streptosporangium sp. NPDC051023]|uniref:sensor histidine kinase n=1 Tax=Streptosporangium sp. NPDC051023 TaxID=3155410 RepID=UPI00344BCEE6
MRRILAPLISPVTYLRWTCLILGGALAMPYMMAGSLAAGMLRPFEERSPGLLSADPIVFAGVLPLIAVTGLFLPIRALELTAARGLLDVVIDPVLERPRRTWAERRRTAAWFTLHLGIGAVAAGTTLAMVPFAIWLFLLPLLGDRLGLYGTGPTAGWSSAWAPVASVVTLALLVYVAAGAGALLSRFAPALLGPSPADRLSALEERARRLATRNRLARELHDSVGHALSVVTVQAGAAGRVLDRDPEAVRKALSAIEESARAALEDLDHVLGLLREGEGGENGPLRGPVRTLDDLAELVRSTGATAEISGDLAVLPALVSREAYRIAQEALTNAIRHGSGAARLAAAVREDHLDLEVRNAVTERAGRSGGRGIPGMRERVTLLGGALEAGISGGEWKVTVRLPLRGGEEAT